MDLGNIDNYYEANMMFRNSNPKLDLYSEWALKNPPTKTVYYEGIDKDQEIEYLRHLKRGEAIDSLVAQGTIINGGTVFRSIIGSKVKINSYSTVVDSVIFDDVIIEENCRIRNTIIDKNVIVPKGTDIGYDEQVDKSRGFTVSPKGIVVVPHGFRF